jgi:O-antigen ligase
LVATAAVLGSLAVYQELAHAPSQQFAGFAQRDLQRGPAVETHSSGGLRSRDRVNLANRALGPIGDPNRFAQVLLFALPLAAFRIRDEKRRNGRLLAIVCSAAILGGVFCTYSRGAYVALALLVGVALLLGYLRWRHVLLAGVAGLACAFILAPGTLVRLQKLESIPSLLTDRQYTNTDGAVRGRLTEMLAAYHVFLDHPLVGVGPAHFSPYYSVAYMGDPDITFRQLAEPRRAHNLYLEMGAETGILGVSLFLGAIAVLLVQLEGRRRRWADVRPELEHYAAAFLLAILSYLGTAVFLHLSFQRYLGLLLGLAGACVQALLVQAEGARVAAPIVTTVHPVSRARGA